MQQNKKNKSSEDQQKQWFGCSETKLTFIIKLNLKSFWHNKYEKVSFEPFQMSKSNDNIQFYPGQNSENQWSIAGGLCRRHCCCQMNQKNRQLSNTRRKLSSICTSIYSVVCFWQWMIYIVTYHTHAVIQTW